MKNRIIISSILTIALCLSMIAGSTFALFTSESKVDVTVSAGTVDVDVDASNLTIGSTLGTALGDADLNGNVITLTNLVPGDYVTFTLTITNKSNVTVNYRALVKTVEDKGLLDGLVITYNNAFASDWKKLEPTTANVAEVVVTISLPEDASNDYQNTSCKLAYVVEAVQGNVEIVDGIEYRTNENGQKVLYDVFGETPSVVTVPEGVEVIGNWSLYDATFEAINLPSTLKTIGSRAFKGNTALKSVTIPAGTETIVEGAFQQSSLESATINGGSIGNQAFGYISTLETVILGENVSYVGNYAFRGCASLKTVVILSENIEFGGTSMAFSNAESGKSDNITIYVPNDAVAAKVKAANGSCTGYTVVVGDPRVSDPQDVKDALLAGNNVILQKDVSTSADTTAPYGNKLGFSQNGGTLDGNGKKIAVSGGGDTYAIMTTGGTIKNVSIVEGFRGIMIMYANQDIIVDNVTIAGSVGYSINTGEHATVEGVDLIVTNSTINGWTSFAGLASASFTNCTFGQGKYWGETSIYGRVFKPYIGTTLTNCDFTAHINFDLTALAQGQKIVMTNCTANGVVLTADNYANYITIELPDGRALADCVVFG